MPSLRRRVGIGVKNNNIVVKGSGFGMLADEDTCHRVDLGRIPGGQEEDFQSVLSSHLL